MKNIIITILVILVLGLGGYLVYDKVIDKDNSNEVTKNNQGENKEENFDLVEAKKLVDKYTLNNFFFYQSIFDNKLNNSKKMYIAIKNTNSSTVTINCKDYFPNAKYINGGYEINNSFCSDGMTTKLYKYEDLNKTYKELFGASEELPKTYSNEVFDRFSYSDKYDAYVKLSCNCGGAPALDSYYDVVSAKTLNDELYISVKYIKFSSYYNPTSSIEIYSYLGENEIYQIETTEHGLSNDQLKAVYDKEVNYLAEYIFKFKKNNDDYYLVSIEKDIY